MTVAATLAASGRLELILAIEGIGWPVDEADLSSGFQGDVFTTADQDGDLVTQLSCTVHRGLRLTSTIGDALDPASGDYSVGGLSCSVTDYDGFLLGAFTPHREDGNQTTLAASFPYNDTEPHLTDGTNFATGDVVWIANGECVKLGTKTLVSGTEYKYTGTTRAYVGTPRGRVTGLPLDGSGFEWKVLTEVYQYARYWYRRNVELYLHVPGESAANVVRIWSGKLTKLDPADAAATVFNVHGAGEVLREFSRSRIAVDAYVQSSYAVWDEGLRSVDTPGRVDAGATIQDNSAQPPDDGNRRVLRFSHAGLTQRQDFPYAIALAYQYRTEPGGTYGMVSGWDAGAIQARDTATDNDVLMEFVLVGEKGYLALKRNVLPDGTADLIRNIRTENLSRLGGNGSGFEVGSAEKVESIPADTRARVLLSNWLDDVAFNRYTVNGRIRRNPIDVLLCHLTSRDDEYYIADATGGTTTVPTFAAGVGDNDVWIGAALHCVEGTNKGEARVITDNDNTSITVEDAFSNTPTASTEYQVRNSVYDVLPAGWGLGIPYHRIDVDSFEAVRDQYMADAELGRFYLGVEDRTEIWDLLRTNILQPYGVHVYIDRTTGKLKAEYLGEAFGDGVVSSYTAIGDDDLIEVPQALAYNITTPVRSVSYTVRATEDAVVDARSAIVSRQGTTPVRVQGVTSRRKTTVQAVEVAEVISERVPGDINGATSKRTITLEDVGLPRYGGAGETISFDARFNTDQGSKAFLETRAQFILRAYSVPPPTIELKLSAAHVLTVRANSFLVLTLADAPANPFTGAAGWSSVVARVVSSSLMLQDGSPHGVAVVCELLTELGAGKVAPAATLSGAAATDGTSAYFPVNPTDYVSDAANDKDYYDFAVGDRIEVRDPDGSDVAAGPFTIRSFGANDVSDPTAASTDIIRIDQAAPGGTAADDYVTFSSYSGSNTSNMDDHAAYGTGTTYTGGDAIKKYG